MPRRNRWRRSVFPANRRRTSASAHPARPRLDYPADRTWYDRIVGLHGNSGAIRDSAAAVASGPQFAVYYLSPGMGRGGKIALPTEESRAEHLGAGRLQVWASSPLSYVAAPPVHPVELRARIGRRRSARAFFAGLRTPVLRISGARWSWRRNHPARPPQKE
jgi:hypothetical protein